MVYITESTGLVVGDGPAGAFFCVRATSRGGVARQIMQPPVRVLGTCRKMLSERYLTLVVVDLQA